MNLEVYKHKTKKKREQSLYSCLEEIKSSWKGNIGDLIQNWIELSIDRAKELDIAGKDLTPFLISEINSLSQNKSLDANTALIVNNALLAGKIAKNFSLV